MFDDHFISQEQEEKDFHYPTLSEINQDMAWYIGKDRPDQAWVLTGFDVWERNPFYSGPEQPHPEDYRPEGEEVEMLPSPPREIIVPVENDDEIPF